MSLSPIRYAAAIGLLLLGLPASIFAEDGNIPLSDDYRTAVEAALQRAGANGGQLRIALQKVEPEMRDGMQFLIANMPDQDLRSLKSDFLLSNVRTAYRTRKHAWARNIDEELFLNDVLPYASVDERRDDWRGDFYKKFLPVVKDCKSPGEAAHKLNQEVFKMVAVKYSTKRNKANQSPYESMEIGLASCTGLSVILTDACRAVGVPARVAGTPLWMNKRGNHTWVEVWDGTWKVVGAAEPSGNGLDHAWFLGEASRADDSKWQHRIYATSFKKTGVHFPMVWNARNRSVPAVNVTQSYYRFGKPKSKPAPAGQPPKKTDGTGEIKLMIQLLDRPGGKRVAKEVTVSSKGTVLKKGVTPKSTHDANRFLELTVSQAADVTLSYEDTKGVVRTRRLSDGKRDKKVKSGNERQVDLYLSE